MDKIGTTYGRKLSFIKKKLPKRNFYTMHEFYLICPYSHEELKVPNRSRDIMQWRQLGMVWSCLSGNSLVESGRMFGKDHATVVYSQEMIVYALDGFHPLLNEKLQDVLESIEIAQTEEKDFNTSLIISSRHIERLLKNKYKRINQMK